MKQLLTYCLLFFAILQSCEQIYTPEIEVVETPIVVDARIVSGGSGNFISIYNSLGYNDEQKVYPPVSGAVVSIISNTGEEVMLKESMPGKFPANLKLEAKNQYKLKISYAGKTYESGFEPVPHAPSIDTVYGEAAKKIIAPEGNNDAGDFIETVGVQLFSDILDEEKLPYFRFTARAVLQYTYTVYVPSPSGPMELTRYAWGSITPGDTYNVAAPDRFTSSESIVRHPLYFLSKRPYLAKESFMVNGPYFNGWILILYQHRLSQPAYNFYDDLNKQMEASGKMFDPLYVQARNNLTCVSDPGEIILGNFEISTVTETRYFVNFLSDKLGYIVRPIPYFYFIPEEGDILGYPPDFWEASKKEYPSE